MGDIDNKPDKVSNPKKTFETCAALSRDVDVTEYTSLSPMRVTTAEQNGYLDFSTDQEAVARKKEQEAIARKKCDSLLYSQHETVGGSLGRPVTIDDNDATRLGTGRASGGSLNDAGFFGTVGSNYELGCPAGGYAGGQLDFGPNNQLDWGKKSFDKKFFDKKFSKEQDFPKISLIAPAVAGFMDRVDKNNDGKMTSREINSALKGDDFDKKEKYVLKILKENKNSIDTDKNGISVAEMKEFDKKITQYQREMALARKYVPELAEFSRELRHSGKLIDDNQDGKFSREELTNFYIERKKEFLADPSSQTKRELSALNWGLNNYDRYATMTGRPGGGQISLDFLQTQMLREMDREVAPGFRQYFLSPSDRVQVERYQNSR